MLSVNLTLWYSPVMDFPMCSFTVAQSGSCLMYISAKICAVRGSTVDIRCIYRVPSTVKRRYVTAKKILWFTEVQDKGAVDLTTDPEYAGRVKYFCDKTTCTLRITDLRESDSSEYKFTFKNKQDRRFNSSPGVTLSVTGRSLHSPACMLIVWENTSAPSSQIQICSCRWEDVILTRPSWSVAALVTCPNALHSSGTKMDR